MNRCHCPSRSTGLHPVLILLIVAAAPAAWANDRVTSAPWIGYTELSTNLPGGRHANVRTMRAKLVRADAAEAQAIGEDLADQPDTWTQFAGWSPDGATAIVARGWQSPVNAAWEEEHKTFRFTAEGWSLDSYLIDLATRRAQNVTAVDRVSFYNAGLFFWPNDASKLGFTALIDGNSHPFKMDRDGRNKIDLTAGSKEFAYGFSSSRDGTRIAYHKSYQVYLADADGANAVRVETGQPFNFAPTWSPDGNWVLFVAGEHYNCHPHIVRADGSGLKKIADRGGYRGVTEFLDVPDFHGGSSDIPVWANDGQSVFLTALVEDRVELFRMGIDGERIQLTTSLPGTTHYHPQPSPDGKWLLYGSKRDGVRQLVVRELATGSERQLTRLPGGRGAMWAHWQPVLASSRSPEPAAQIRRRRVLYNFDGDSCLSTKAGGKGPVAVTADDVKQLIEEVAYDGSLVDTILVCVNAQVMYYPSQVGTMRGALSISAEREKWPPSEKQRFQNLKAFFDAGVDPYAVMISESKRRGKEALLTFRMNDDHGNDFLRTQFWIDHPEFRLGKGALDFGADPVRDYTARLIEEAVRRYDCDGIELDFNRFPRFFKEETTEGRVQKMNTLVERVRRSLDAIGQERGRRLILGVRIPSNFGRSPPTIESARALGCDVVDWSKRGWIDFVTVSEFLFTRYDLPLRPWKEAITTIPVYGGIECTEGGSRGQYLTPEKYRKAAALLRGEGADGIYLFNFFTTREYGADAWEPPFEVLRDL